jgi:hypothetical protein
MRHQSSAIDMSELPTERNRLDDSGMWLEIIHGHSSRRRLVHYELVSWFGKRTIAVGVLYVMIRRDAVDIRFFSRLMQVLHVIGIPFGYTNCNEATSHLNSSR